VGEEKEIQGEIKE